MATTAPIIISEWPDMYFVTASITISTPNSKGLKYSAVAHVLSMIDFNLYFLQTRITSSISIISKVYVPGVSI